MNFRTPYRVAPWGILRRYLAQKGYRVNLWADPPLTDRDVVEMWNDPELLPSGHLCRKGQVNRAGNWIAREREAPTCPSPT